MVSGCPGTGSADWRAGVLEVWGAAAQALSLTLDSPPEALLQQHRLPLLAALIPTALADAFPLPLAPVKAAFFRRFYTGLAAQFAEWMRRRGALIAAAATADDPEAPPPQARSPPLPPERHLRIQDLRRLEIQRRSTAAPPAVPAALPGPAVPHSGEARRRWLRSRLERLLQEDTVPCPQSQAVAATELLALFESTTQEAFADTPGVRLASRVCGFGKVMGNITREVSFDPPLQQFSRRGWALWSRRPRDFLDVTAWNAPMLQAERTAPPALRLRAQVWVSNAALVDWVRTHKHLAAPDVESGESWLPLLLLWEVAHGCSFPRQGGLRRSAWAADPRRRSRFLGGQCLRSRR